MLDADGREKEDGDTDFDRAASLFLLRALIRAARREPGGGGDLPRV